MDAYTKELMLERFHRYLDDISMNEDADPGTGESESVDLFTLFSEMAALKNEVKVEARQVKAALEQFKEIFAAFEQNRAEQRSELERSREAERQAGRQSVRELLLELLELRDRIEAGLQVAQRYRPSWLAGFSARERKLIEGLRSGQAITLRRLDQCLAARHVRPLETVGRPLDPHCMRAAEIECRPELDQGVVTGELRKGFLWGEEILRTAEVKVNKLNK